ncbi:RrF2 family transcriptional regulator [Haloglycomyces albus]|uniref:RrF2 family transcriptional regulator n=1 Tax=Haloglycomyces albus TaxID=526067 RepID=UPI00046D8477|nr:Rrf2 family transcriptional regulator [Haloglycomyces albus]
MRLSARVDYALRATAVLAAAPRDEWVRADSIASEQEVPRKFLESILVQLRNGSIVQSKRGADGGHRLSCPADEVSLADIIRCVDGPLLGVRGQRPEHIRYRGAAGTLTDVLIALRAAERNILEHVTLADIAAGTLPGPIADLVDDPDAWTIRDLPKSE